MECKEVLVAARELIQDRQRWTQESGARRADGVPVRPSDPTAVRWCVMGAVTKEVETNYRGNWNLLASCNDLLDKATLAVYPNLAKKSIPNVYVNDTYGHDAVLDVLDLAIQLAP